MLAKTLFGQGVVTNAAWTAAEGDVAFVDHRVPLHNFAVLIGVANITIVHAHHRAVIDKVVATPHAADKTHAHVSVAVVDAAIVADVATPVAGVEDVDAF